MAVPEQTPYIEHTGNGVTTSFSLGFQCESKDHLIVLIDDIEPPIATWSLTGGNVVFTTAPAAGKKITLQRNTPFSRTTDYQSYNNSFRPPAVNKDFDWIWLKLQELGVADWILSNRIDALKNYVDDRDDELRAYLMEEIHKQGVALDQLDEYYNYLMQRLAQIAVDKGWSSDFVVTPQGETQQEVNDRGGSYWHAKPLGYGLGSRVMLENGDIVRSTEPNNTNNPNENMDGWVKVNDASQIFTLTALSQEMFNQKVERQTANHSVNLVDFLTRKQWKDWQEDNESLDFTVALETAFSTMYNSAPFLNGIRWGVGEIILPRGVIRLDLRQIQLNKAYGLILRGQGAAATQIKTNRAAPTTPTELNDSLFRSEGYTYLELSDFSVTCTNQDINFIRLYGAGGGRELLMRNVTTQGFKHIKHIEGNTNADTNYADRCTFGACKSVVYTRNNQAMVNTYLHCTFGVGIAKAFDVTGFGYTAFISCNVVTGGKFYHVASDGSSFFGQVVTFINTKLEHNVDGKSQLLTSDNNPNVYIFAKFIGSGMVSADTPDPSIYQIDVAGKLKIEIDGGEWNKCKFRFGQSIDYNTTVDIKNCSNPPPPTNISFLEYQAGYAYNYPSVNFKNNLNMLDLIVRHEKSTAANFSTQNCISQRGAALLQSGSATPNTRTFDMKGQRCLVNSLDLYVKSWSSITNLRVSVFADAAFTVPMNTEQVITVPAASGSTPFKVNIPLTVQSFTDKLYVRITNDQLYGVVIGHFKLDTEFL